MIDNSAEFPSQNPNVIVYQCLEDPRLRITLQFNHPNMKNIAPEVRQEMGITISITALTLAAIASSSDQLAMIGLDQKEALDVFILNLARGYEVVKFMVQSGQEKMQ